MKTYNNSEIIKALRCSATVGSKCQEGCPYRIKIEITAFGDDEKKYHTSCDCDQIVLDAAQALENFQDATSMLLGKFICQIGEMAEKNWCSSQVEMLERLIGAVLEGVEYADWEKKEVFDHDGEGTD